MAGRTDVVRPFAGLEGRLGGDEDGIAPALDGLAEDFFRETARIDISGIEHVEPSLETDVHEAGCFRDVGSSPGAKRSPLPPKVPVPKLSAGTFKPEPPSCLYSKEALRLEPLFGCGAEGVHPGQDDKA